MRSLTSDKDLKAQLNAITALGRSPDPETETLLLGLWRDARRPELRRALLRSLGKAGGPATLAVLGEVAPSRDAEEQRLLEQARLILARTTTRDGAVTTRMDVALDGIFVDLHCRAGLAPLLASEVGSKAAPKVISDDRVRLKHAGTLADLMHFRLMDHFSFPLLGDSTGAASDVATKAFSSPVAKQIFAALAEGAPRYRIEWPDAPNAQVWGLAKTLTERCPDRVNDPTGSLWELRILTGGQGVEVSLVPKRLPDTRFSYREQTVAASSHPTIAAALARLAAVKPNDVVWDPFCGAGAELVECARLGRPKALIGSDVSEAAIAAASANLKAAGIGDADLRAVSCFDVKGLRPTLIVTNPPMGRRVARGELKPLLDQFIEHVANELAPEGRLVWLSPLPERTAEALGKFGFVLTYHRTVDMGGFPAELQVATRRDAKVVRGDNPPR